jgi:hypothetical protein
VSIPFERLGLAPHPGSSVSPGHTYHSLPFPEYRDIPAHRPGTASRVLHMTSRFPVAGLRGLDIGCAVGGISFGFQMQGASMVGVDSDPAAIAVALEVEAIHKTGATFFCEEFPSPHFSRILNKGHDFAVFLSAFMWLADSYGMANADIFMERIAKKVPVLWFESAQAEGDGSAWKATPFRSPKDIEEYLRRFYPSVTDTGIPAGGWFPRNVFLCKR